MARSPIRYKRLLTEIPKHKTARDALIASGFSEKTANHQANRAMKSAMKYHVKEVLDTIDNKEVKTKRLMTDILDISSEQLFNRLKYLALGQDKDFGSALKVLAPLAKEHGIILSADDDAQKAPSVINVLVEKHEAPVIEGNVQENAPSTDIDAPNTA